MKSGWRVLLVLVALGAALLVYDLAADGAGVKALSVLYGRVASRVDRVANFFRPATLAH